MQTLAEYMDANGITDEKLGQMAGLSRSAVSRIRRGIADPPASTLRRIAAACGGKVTFDMLVSPARPAQPEAVSA